MNVNKIGILILIATTIACNSNASRQEKIIDSPKEFSFLDDQLIYSDTIFQIESVIPLETTTENLMAGVDKVVRYNGEYLVLDGEFSNLFRYDLEGSFLGKIGKLGRGPGELQGIDNFFLDEERGLLVLYSSKDMALFEFTLDFKFKRKVNLEFFASSFVLIPNEGYFFNVNYNVSEASGSFNILKTDFDGVITDRWISLPKQQFLSVGFSGGFKYDELKNKGYYLHALSDTIYGIDFDQGIIETEYIFDFKGKSWPHGFDFIKVAQNGLEYSYLNKINLFNDYMFISYSHNAMIRFMLLDLNDDKLYSEFNTMGLLPLILQLPSGYTTEGKFISSITSNYYISYQNVYPDLWKHYTDNYPELTEELSVLFNEDNPVLIEFSIR